MTDDSDEKTIAATASKHGVTPDAVRVVLEALRRGGGTMAQFSHPEFGGMAQWSRGMTMVGDMFNDTMRSKLDAVARDLVDAAGKPAVQSSDAAPSANEEGASPTSRHASDAPRASNPQGNPNQSTYAETKQTHQNWWPADLGSPHSTGAQNATRYAIFEHRLAIDEGGTVTIYDTGDHDISGIAQAQGSGSSLTLTGRTGRVNVSDLRRVS